MSALNAGDVEPKTSAKKAACANFIWSPTVFFRMRPLSLSARGAY
jgi:hypothetical protein